jgi:hypothetical protein
MINGLVDVCALILCMLVSRPICIFLRPYLPAMPVHESCDHNNTIVVCIIMLLCAYGRDELLSFRLYLE